MSSSEWLETPKNEERREVGLVVVVHEKHQMLSTSRVRLCRAKSNIRHLMIGPHPQLGCGQSSTKSPEDGRALRARHH